MMTKDALPNTRPMTDDLAVPQYRLPAIVFMFTWPIVWFAFLIYWIGPMLLRPDGFLPTWAGNLIWLLGNGLELAVALIILRGEGYRLTLSALRERIHWHWPDTWWKWAAFVGVFAVAYGVAMLLMPTQQTIAGALPPPEYLPDHPLREIDSLQAAYPDVGLAGNYRFFIYRFIVLGFMLNVLGEELYYRAALQPRMRGVFGRWAWVANGLGFALKHLYYWWRVPLLVPAALGFAFLFGPMGSLPLSILAHWIANDLVLFLLAIPALFELG
jgi:membrane protease YdiL (CAAX protease family)